LKDPRSFLGSFTEDICLKDKDIMLSRNAKDPKSSAFSARRSLPLHPCLEMALEERLTFLHNPLSQCLQTVFILSLSLG
jgi:hypothetical protein